MATAISAHGQPADEQALNDRKLRFGMLFYIVTDVAFAIFLTAAYPFLRQLNTNAGWFPYHFQPDFSTSNAITIALVVSTVLFLGGLQALNAGNQQLFKWLITLAALVMLGSLYAQIQVLRNVPFAATDGSFASTYITLSYYHLYHLIIGSFLALGVMVRALHERYSADRSTGLRLIGYFWSWVAIYSVVLTLLPIVLPPNV
jgi:heme/copper-type cytochrome/quinol oxidase subunit 3